MITLLRHTGIGEPSCHKLVKRMAELGIKVTRAESYDDSLADTDILIRWGNTSYWPEHNKNLIVINKRKSIELGANKKESRRILLENRLSVPWSYFSKREALDYAQNFPLIGRPEYHTQGKNIEFIKSRAELENSNSAYYSEFIPKEREFRVYVFGDKAIGMVEKIPQDKNDIAWNSHKGAEFFDIEDFNYGYKHITNEAVKAAKIIGQHFSGVDLMLYKDNPYVLELNSSLALSNPHRVDIFAQAFKKFIQNH